MLDVRFSDTEMTADSKTINVFVDDVMSRVEIFRAAESAGHSGWSIVDCGDGDLVVVEGSDAGEDLPKLPNFEESDEVDISDLPGFDDEGDDEDLLQEMAG